MRKYILKTSLFISPFILFVIIGVCMPTTPRASLSLLMAETSKNTLLQNTPSPRIIFVGGSNLSFGLNSQEIKDSLGLNPINTSIQASIGIKYMMDNTMKYIRKGDIVVLVPEYQLYYNSLNQGSKELMRTVFDVNFYNIKNLNIIQFINILPLLPEYAITKFKPSEYHPKVDEDDIYAVNSFNQYGDAFRHWTKKDQHDKIVPIQLKNEFNPRVIDYLISQNKKLEKKGAVLLISYPCFQESSYLSSLERIEKVEKELKKSGLNIIGTPERYKMADTLMFNTPYHTNKTGVDRRTKRVIEDIREFLTSTNHLYK